MNCKSSTRNSRFFFGENAALRQGVLACRIFLWASIKFQNTYCF